MSGLSCGTRDILLQQAQELLSSCGMSSKAQAPKCAGSVVAVHGSLVVALGLSCPAARGIFFPRPGIELASPALEGGFLTTGPPGKSPFNAFFFKKATHAHDSSS